MTKISLKAVFRGLRLKFDGLDLNQGSEIELEELGVFAEFELELEKLKMKNSNSDLQIFCELELELE